MKYTVLIYSNPAVDALFSGMTADEKKAAYQLYWDVESDLEASGELVDSKAIDEAGQHFVHVASDGSTTVEDVPLGANGEVVTGYYLVDVADEARAVEIAARFPEARVPHGIRVGRVYTQEDFDAL